MAYTVLYRGAALKVNRWSQSARSQKKKILKQIFHFFSFPVGKNMEKAEDS